MYNPAIGRSKTGDSQQSAMRPGRKPRPFLSFYFLAAVTLAVSGLAGTAQAIEPPGSGAAALPVAPHIAQQQTILPRMGLEEALEAFERNYRAPQSAAVIAHPPAWLASIRGEH